MMKRRKDMFALELLMGRISKKRRVVRKNSLLKKRKKEKEEKIEWNNTLYFTEYDPPAVLDISCFPSYIA